MDAQIPTLCCDNLLLDFSDTGMPAERKGAIPSGALRQDSILKMEHPGSL
jgi:hypothetical protein